MLRVCFRFSCDHQEGTALSFRSPTDEVRFGASQLMSTKLTCIQADIRQWLLATMLIEFTSREEIDEGGGDFRFVPSC